MELAMPSQPSTWLIGSSTTCMGMNTPNSSSANISSLPRKRHLLST
jgi:hypothetical protein